VIPGDYLLPHEEERARERGETRDVSSPPSFKRPPFFTGQYRALKARLLRLVSRAWVRINKRRREGPADWLTRTASECGESSAFPSAALI